MKIISFEGCIGAGKTSLTNYFSYEFKIPKILEGYEKNPFLKEFYEKADVNFETEITFLLIHYYQIKNAINKSIGDLILSDFSIEKDLVYAKMNLRKDQLSIFDQVYDYVFDEIGVPHVTIYVDLSLKILKRRIFQRGRTYELNGDHNYIIEYNERAKEYFKNYAKSTMFFINVDDLDLDPENMKLCQIRNLIQEMIKD